MRNSLLCMPLLAASIVAGTSHAAVQDDTDQPVAMRADLGISAVTLYRGRAAVTRSGEIALPQGLFELRVGPLPESADLDSVQARIGGGGKLLEVKSETVVRPAPTSDNPRVREAFARVEAALARWADVERRTVNNVASQKTIDSIAAKVASDASQGIGTALDPEKLKAQLAFIDAERDRLTAESLVLKKEAKDAAGELNAANDALNAAGGAPPVERFALVTMVAPQGGDVPVSVTYLAANASWAPSYTVRGNPDAGTLALEFDAVVQQSTGEDWRDVALVLSTAQPTRAANPRDIPPTYVNILEPVESGAPPAPRMAPGAPMMDAAPAMGRPAGPGGGGGGEGAEFAAKRFAGLAADASVGGTGPAVEYRLPRTFTAASDANAERRTRVATIESKPQYALVARPLVDSDVYLRARFLNETGYLLLPGQARMYLGADSIGRVGLGETPVGGEVELWFGKEPRVTVKRELVAKKNTESGLISKSKGIDRDYRISVTNTLARAVELELWDRVPVSRNEDVKIELREVAPALSSDAKYLRDFRPQGLLKWTLSLPARAGGADAKPTTVSWKTRTSWPEGKTIVGDAD
ncbi:MAG: mucoidy inhibitor MuiA family protein [Planctomycetota bacterium]